MWTGVVILGQRARDRCVSVAQGVARCSWSGTSQAPDRLLWVCQVRELVLVRVRLSGALRTALEREQVVPPHSLHVLKGGRGPCVCSSSYPWHRDCLYLSRAGAVWTVLVLVRAWKRREWVLVLGPGGCSHWLNWTRCAFARVFSGGLGCWWRPSRDTW